RAATGRACQRGGESDRGEAELHPAPTGTAGHTGILSCPASLRWQDYPVGRNTGTRPAAVFATPSTVDTSNSAPDAPLVTCVSMPTPRLSTPAAAPIMALTCDDGHGPVSGGPLRVLTWTKRKGQRTHG